MGELTQPPVAALSMLTLLRRSQSSPLAAGISPVSKEDEEFEVHQWLGLGASVFRDRYAVYSAYGNLRAT